MLIKDISITKLQTSDIRFPTNKTSQGSDALHTNPNYSTCYVTIHAKHHTESISSHGIIFTIGKGTDIVAKCVSELAYIIEGHTLGEIVSNFPHFIFKISNEPQLRWLGPQKGVVHLATSGIINALWDLWGKAINKPLWLLLSELSSQQIVSLLDFTYIADQLSKEQALKILKAIEPTRKDRIQFVKKNGMPAYTTAVGWSGYSQEKVRKLAKDYISQGFTHFKVKVGLGVEKDMKRCELMRQCIGYDKCQLMMDANQIWGVNEAIENMQLLSKFKPLWIEEPTAPDDVIGHLKISKAIHPIGVATGEHAHNRVLHKHFASMGAYQFCQSDPCRLAGMNQLILVMLMAKKFAIPVCLHTGGVGLCQMGIHAAIFDFVGICGTQENRITEYSGALHQHFLNPVVIKNGKYMVPQAIGYASDLTEKAVKDFMYPNGTFWKTQAFLQNFTPFKGIMSPSFSPFSSDGKSMNLGLIQEYAQILVKQGVNGVWVNGSSGQWANMTKDQRKASIEAWVNTSHHKKGQLKIISHIATNSLQDSIDLAKHSQSLGVFGLAISCPSYYKPQNEQAIAQWVHAIAKQVSTTPIYYYHIPVFNNVQSNVYKTLKLCRDLSPNVVGAKFTDSKLDQLAMCQKAGFNMLVGMDTLFVNALACGVDGIVGISVNFMGRKFRDMYDIIKQSGKEESRQHRKVAIQQADQIQSFIRNVFEAFKGTNGGVLQISKYLMLKLWGLDFGPMRLPITNLSVEKKAKVNSQVIQKYF